MVRLNCDAADDERGYSVYFKSLRRCFFERAEFFTNLAHAAARRERRSFLFRVLGYRRLGGGELPMQERNTKYRRLEVTFLRFSGHWIKRLGALPVRG